MSSKVSVGMVGLGLVARAHAKGYAHHPQAELLAVCDLDREHARGFAAEHGVGMVYTDYGEMLANPAIDAIDIATPTFLHAPMAKQAALAGKHVHCEKPFCRSVSEGMGVVAAVRQSRVKLLVGETYVFLTSHIKARDLIAAGEIGRPRQVRQRHAGWLRRKEAAIPVAGAGSAWRADPVRSGGGEFTWMFDHAVHLFATAEYLMLDLPVAEVYSLIARNDPRPGPAGQPRNPYADAKADIPIVTWTYADDACQGVWMRAGPLNGKYDYMRGFCTTIIGETGVIEVLGEGGHNLLWEGQQQHLVLHRDGKETVCFRFDEGGDDHWDSDIAYYSQGHTNQVQHFVDCILGDRQPRYTGEDGVRAVQCTLATIRSAQEHRPIGIAEIGPDYTAFGGR